MTGVFRMARPGSTASRPDARLVDLLAGRVRIPSSSSRSSAPRHARNFGRPSGFRHLRASATRIASPLRLIPALASRICWIRSIPRAENRFPKKVQALKVLGGKGYRCISRRDQPHGERYRTSNLKSDTEDKTAERDRKPRQVSGLVSAVPSRNYPSIKANATGR